MQEGSRIFRLPSCWQDHAEPAPPLRNEYQGRERPLRAFELCFLPLRRIACHGTKLRIRITAFVVASAQKRMWPGHSDLASLARRGRFLHEAAKEFPRLGCTALIGCQDGCRLRKLRFLQKRHREYSACFLYQ